MNNGFLVCRGHCHRLLHEKRWTVTGSANTTQYYLSFNINSTSAPVINNDIPIDAVPLAGVLAVSKTTPKADVVIGELVPYTVTIKNPQAYRLTGVGLIDQMPPGFKYKTGTGRIDAAAVEPLLTGRTLTWKGLVLEANQTIIVKLMLVVGAGVGQSEYTNQAWTINTLSNTITSNVGTATVRVAADPSFDCSDVVGKVFDDRKRSGYLDDGDPGIPNVRLATVHGELVTTDDQGRYHIACADIPNADRGSNFILKLDVRTLPTGYRLTTENPGLVRLTRGKLAKLNFGASIGKVVRIDMQSAAFMPGSTQLAPQWEASLPQVLGQITEAGSILRLAYGVAGAENMALTGRRTAAVADKLRSLWRDQGNGGELTVETEVYHAR